MNQFVRSWYRLWICTLETSSSRSWWAKLILYVFNNFWFWRWLCFFCRHLLSWSIMNRPKFFLQTVNFLSYLLLRYNLRYLCLLNLLLLTLLLDIHEILRLLLWKLLLLKWHSWVLHLLLCFLLNHSLCLLALKEQFISNRKRRRSIVERCAYLWVRVKFRIELSLHVLTCLLTKNSILIEGHYRKIFGLDLLFLFILIKCLWIWIEFKTLILILIQKLIIINLGQYWHLLWHHFLFLFLCQL